MLKRNVHRHGRLPRCRSAVAPDGAKPIKPAVSRRILRVPALTHGRAGLAWRLRPGDKGVTTMFERLLIIGDPDLAHIEEDDEVPF